MGFALLSVLLVASLWVIPYLPTNDGPESVLAVHIENHFGDPGTLYRDVFEPAPQFAGRGFTILFEPLEDMLGWQRGLQVALSVIVLTCAWGFVALVSALDPRKLPLAFFGFPLALSWPFYMGFFAFVLSSGVGLFILAASLKPPTPSRRAVLALALLLQAFLHMFPAILTGIIVAAALVARAPRGQRLREAAYAIAVGVPAALLVLAAFVVARKSATTAAFSEGFAFLPIPVRLAAWPRTLAPGPLSRALFVTALVTVAAGISAIRALRRGTSPVERVFALFGIVFLLAAFFAPRDVPGWQCFSERFVSVGIALVIVALPVGWMAPRGRLITSLCFAVSIALVAVAYPFHKRLADASSDAIAGLAAPVERHRIWLPVTLEPTGRPLTPIGEAEVPLLAPLRHIGALYATVEGGLTPYTFASNPATWPFAIRSDAIRPPPVPSMEHYISTIATPDFQTNRAFRHEQENELATYGMFYEGVLLTGARPEDEALWHKRGYVADWEHGSVMVAHFEPCSIDLELREGAEQGDPPRIDVGVGAKVILRDLEREKVLMPDGSTHLLIEQGPCGRAWVKPHWDGSTGGKSVRSFCATAGENGEVSGLFTREEHRVLCTGKVDGGS